MTEQELAEIETRLAAATGGPWYPFVSPWADKMHAVTAINEAGPPIAYVGNKVIRENDQNLVFIAAARTDIPALLAECRRLRAENERLRTALAHYADAGNWTRSSVVAGRSLDRSLGPFDWYSADPPDSNGFDVAQAALEEKTS